MKMTIKQTQIMEAVLVGNRDAHGHLESWLDIDQLIERVPYEATKQAFQCSLRFLRQKGLIEAPTFEVRRGRKRTLVVPAATATAALTAPVPRTDSEAIDEDEDLEESCDRFLINSEDSTT